MDGFRDRFGSRYDRNSGRSTSSGGRGGMDRERGAVDRGGERYDYGGRDDYQDRDDYGRRMQPQPGTSMDGGSGGGVSGRQLEIIRDYFDEAKDDSKEILRAVNSNAKMLDRSFSILEEIKDQTDRPVTQAVQAAPQIDLSGPIQNIQDLGKSNKEEIVKAIAENADLLNLIKEQVSKNAEAISGISKEEGSAFDKEEIEKYFTDLTDHVHKENVKCYRNVAGALEEYDKKNEEKGSGIGVVKIFSVIQLALTVLNVVLLALYIFRVI